MKKGFTLIELMIVIIIIGILATVGIVQYQAAVEKARGAEAKQMIGSLRSLCAAIYMEMGNTTDCNETNLRLGTSALDKDLPGSTCDSRSYFNYSISGTGDGAEATFTANRCTTTNGKKVKGESGRYLKLTVNYTHGTDTWDAPGY